jgi:hypothetical protein
MTLVLGLTSLSLEAQMGGKDSHRSDGKGCSCQAEGADCLFGDVGGCSVACSTDNCKCQSGGCRLGFPVGAKCSCG